MSKYKLLFIFIALIVFMSSCQVGIFTTKKAMRTTTFMPDKVELRLTLDDFVLVGETEVTINYNRYLGFITKLHEINGEAVIRNKVNKIQTFGRSWLPLGPYLDRALYDVQVKYSEAEIFIPVYIVTEKQQLFLGAKVKKTLKVKAYKIKSN